MAAVLSSVWMTIGLLAVVAFGALRQVSTAFSPIAAVSSFVLPAWLWVTAWLMWRHARPPQESCTG